MFLLVHVCYIISIFPDFREFLVIHGHDHVHLHDDHHVINYGGYLSDVLQLNDFNGFLNVILMVFRDRFYYFYDQMVHFYSLYAHWR